MRIGFSLRASPAGALSKDRAGTPSSLAARSTSGRDAAEYGVQIAPVPNSGTAPLIQYTSHFAASSQFTSLNELLIWWLIRYPAGIAGPVTEAGGGGSRPPI